MILRLIFLLILSASYAQESKFTILDLPKSLTENANSITKSESTFVDVSDSGSQDVYYTKTITILNSKGNSDINAFAFYDNNSKVKKLNATIYDALGNKIKSFSKRDFRDVSAVSNGTLYSDNRVMYLDYTPITYPYTVVFEKETTSKTSAFIERWMPIEDYLSSTVRSTYTIKFNPKNKPIFKEFNFDGYTITTEQKEGEMSWKAELLPAVKHEYLAPNLNEITPMLRLYLPQFSLQGEKGSANSWQDFGNWMNTNLIEKTNDLSSETIEAIRALTSNATTDEEKARIVYKFVQDKVRYISVQIEIGGWKPMLASDVDKLSYGDCKALTNYTKSLMDAVGLTSYYTIIYGGNEQTDIDKDLVAVQGNHVILGVDLNEDITWLECTSQTSPFGYLGDFTDNRDALMITPNGGIITKTKAYNAEESTKRYTINCDIDGTSVKGHLNEHSKGVFYQEASYANTMSQEELKNSYLTEWRHINGLSVTNISLNDDQDNITYQEDLDFTIHQYLSKAGNNFILKPIVFSNSRALVPPRTSNRKTPFIIQRPKTVEFLISYTIPEGMTVNTPEDTILHTPFGEYNLTFSLKDNRLSCKRSLKITEGTFEPNQYEAYRSFCKTITNKDNTKLLISTL